MTPTQKKPTQNINFDKNHAMTDSHQLRAAMSLKEAMEKALHDKLLQQRNGHPFFLKPQTTRHDADGYWQHHPHISRKMLLPHHPNPNDRLCQPTPGRQPGAKWSQ